MSELLRTSLPYLPVAGASAFLHYADIYLLQESPGPVHRSRSFWIYLTAQLPVSLLTAFLVYRKAGLPTADWPLVTALASLGAFSVLQSFTLKFGDKGILSAPLTTLPLPLRRWTYSTARSS